MKWMLIDDYALSLTRRFNVISEEAPDGLYVARFGVATEVTAEDLRDAEKRASCFFFPPPLEAFQRLLDALTQAQGGAE